MTGGQSVPWWHRLHRWTRWEWRTEETTPSIMGVKYSRSWQERRCIRCGLTDRKF